MKERQDFSFTLGFSRSPHYDDAGKLALDPSGINHSFNLNVKLTSDMFDTSFSSSADKKTITYWMKKSQDNEPVEIIFVFPKLAIFSISLRFIKSKDEILNIFISIEFKKFMLSSSKAVEINSKPN